MTLRRTATFVAAALFACLLPAQTAPKITTPTEALGFNIGDDYQVANYTQLEAWWKKLAAESPRMKLESIGKTEEGRDQWMAIVTSPENMKQLARYKEIAALILTEVLQGFADERDFNQARKVLTSLMVVELGG